MGVIEGDMCAIKDGERSELERLGESIAAISVQVDALTRRLLSELREFDRREGWALSGALSCAQWLSWRTGLAPGAARVRVARRLGELPAVEAALERGELTYSKVRAMTRVATAENESTLVEMGTQMTAAQLEETCRRLEQVAPRSPDVAALVEQKRGLLVRRRADGLVVLEVCLTTEEAETVLTAIDCSGDVSAGTRDSARGHTRDSAGAFDRVGGLVAMAEQVLRGGGSEGGPPVEVVVTVESATATGQTSGGDGLDREVVRRLCCDAGVVPVVTDAQGTPMDVGRKRRTISTRLRKALVARDRGCQFPGCTNLRWVDGHHFQHWLSGGETNLENLVLLCRRHHRCLHELGFGLARGEDGKHVFTDPQGRAIHSHIRMNAAAHVPADLPRAPWPATEDEVDYDACIDVLLQAHHAPSARA